ncbi:MAG: sigma-70 family RNA polymerase sigma factor [Gammaproteobacteria bacterium]|nr:sigma-70 family RNA polymerase sigma factor [Gammaproteobacteria bacterium]
MKDPAKENEDLRAALGSDKDTAFTRLVVEHHAGMLRLARAFLREDEAEEVVQDAWIAAYNAIAQFEWRSSIRTWLFRIVINGAKGRLRGANRELTVDFSAVEPDALAGRFMADGHWSAPPENWRAHSPDELLQEQDLIDCLQKTLGLLPQSQRVVLELRDLQGLEFDDICNMLSLGASNVRVLLHRARVRIFNMVDRYQVTGEC